MHRTRSLLASQKKPRPTTVCAVNGLQIPLRGSLEVLASSMQACASFAFSAEKRERFLDLARRGTINQGVLGIPLSLALYHDLSSPLFEKYGFDVDEFGAGARVALENFHNVEFRLQHELAKGVEGRRDAMNADSSSTQTRRGKKSSRGSSSSTQIRGKKKNSRGSSSSTQTRGNKKSSRGSSSARGGEPLRWKLPDAFDVLDEWEKRADNDPESLHGLLSRMITPEYFQHTALVLTKDVWTTSQERLPRLQNWRAEAANLNLLSARAATIPAPPARQEALNKMTEKEIQKNDDIINNVYVDLPVAAQLEVLYDLKITVPLSPYVGKSGTSDSSAKTVTRPLVGVFEGWLHGSPTGSLQWKLALNRSFSGL